MTRLYAPEHVALQNQLDAMWSLVDRGEPVNKVIAWLERGKHRTIDDELARDVAKLMRRGVRSMLLA